MVFHGNTVPGFEINTSCIKGIKFAYKAKEGSKSCQMRGMTKYREADKKADKEVAEEQPTRRTRRSVPKHP